MFRDWSWNSGASSNAWLRVGGVSSRSAWLVDNRECTSSLLGKKLRLRASGCNSSLRARQAWGRDGRGGQGGGREEGGVQAMAAKGLGRALWIEEGCVR